MIKAVIFDLDDTLYDEKQFVQSGFREASRYIALKYKKSEKKTYILLNKVLKINGRGKVFDNVLSDLDIYANQKVIKKLITKYRYCKRKLKFFPQAETVLSKLRRLDYRLGLITDGNSRVQRYKAELLSLNSYFHVLLYSRYYGIRNEKPSVFIYRKCLRKLKVKARESIYVGDNPHKDFITAKKIGVRTVRLMRGRFKHVILDRKYEAERRIHNLKYLPQVIRELERSTYK